MVIKTLFSIFYNRSSSSERSALDRASEAAFLTLMTVAPGAWGLLMIVQAYLSTKIEGVPLAVPKPLALGLALGGVVFYTVLTFKGMDYAQSDKSELEKTASKLMFVAVCVAVSIAVLTAGIYYVSAMVEAGRP